MGLRFSTETFYPAHIKKFKTDISYISVLASEREEERKGREGRLGRVDDARGRIFTDNLPK